MARDPGEDCAVEIRDEVMRPTSILDIKLKVGMYYIIASAQGNGGVYIILALISSGPRNSVTTPKSTLRLAHLFLHQSFNMDQKEQNL